ncbi:hypothetical protein AUI46_05205 [archaeon 13_1_40CM_2_52_13]|nr:MAG: hypothetical protein AUI46_05205 [archaeon 13_1_40CM_2_52_13]
MKFGLVVGGAFLLVAGLLAYSMIPNFHTVPLQSAQMVVNPRSIPVSSASLTETPENVTLVPGRENELLVNLTVSTQLGLLSSIQFKFFPEGAFQSCMLNAEQRGCLVNQTVSNSSIRIPLNASTTYYLGFDNRASSSSKQVLVSATLVASSVSTLVARDGGLNFAGLGMGLIGLLVTLYGVFAKTVIPWE